MKESLCANHGRGSQMSRYLLTVEGSERFGSELQIRPPVRVKELIERDPDLMIPMPGDALQLRLPDGRTARATVARFGVEAFLRDGSLHMEGNPSDPELTLTIADLESDDLPAATEIWLTESHDHDPV
jgi:hypothetical protein